MPAYIAVPGLILLAIAVLFLASFQVRKMEIKLFNRVGESRSPGYNEGEVGNDDEIHPA